MQNIYDLIKTQADRNPESEAIGAPGRSFLSYGGLVKVIEATVASLNRLGIGRNDPVAIVLPNGPEMAVAFVSVASGATSAPLNPNYQAAEFEFFLSDLQAKALVIDNQMDSPAREVARGLGIPIIDLIPLTDQPAGVFQLEGASQPLEAQNGFAQLDEIALVLHTSGTTSRPKIVPLSQRNVLATAQNIRETLQLTTADRCLNIMPLFHIHGLMAAVLSSLSSGASVVCTPGYYATEFYGWLKSFSPSWYTAVPTMHQSILSRATQHPDVLEKIALRFIRSSSASLAPAVMQQLIETFGVPVVEAYGMTEAAHQMSCNPIQNGAQKPGSVGLPAGPEVEIMDIASPRLLRQGEVGEIVIRGENVFSGYANNPDANLTAFSDGWFRTGDQGYKDADGYLYISGRLKEIINRGGEKISPREVDEILLSHPGIAQALTFAMPDPQLGEEVAAAVVLNDLSLTESEIRRFTAEKLIDFKVPRKVVILDEIPKGPTGKLQRIGLAEKLGIKPEPVGSVAREFVAPQTPLEEALAEIWKDQLGLDKIGVNDRFLEMGGDSMLAALLVLEVGKQLGVKLSLTDFSETPTIADQARYLESIGISLDGVQVRPDLVTAFHQDGSQPPLFFMSASVADSFIFPGLSKGLGKDQPLFGLTPYGLEVEVQADQVGYLANIFTQEVQRVQPDGPYYLGGNCSGGTIAFEVARRLIAQGEKVRYLVMTEAYGLNYPQRRGLARVVAPLLQFFYLTSKHFDVLSVSSPFARRQYLKNLLEKQTRRAGNFLRALGGRTAAPAPVGRRSYDFRVGEKYDPAPVVVNVHLIRAAHQPYGALKDDSLGWKALVEGEIKSVEAPGYHGGLYPGQRAQKIGELISEQMEAVRAAD